MLCDEFMRGALDAGNQVEKLCLSDYKINYCTGCGLCSEFGKPCPQTDDMAMILEKMIAADVLVMATPVYFYTMNAQMKTLITVPAQDIWKSVIRNSITFLPRQKMIGH